MKFAMILSFALFCFHSQAHAWNSGRADYCTAQDKGWEEHWGGHSSCSECLRKHGKCVETCYSKEYKVVVTGIVRDGWSNTDREEEFFGVGDSEWQAESEALRNCSWRNAYNCRTKSSESRDNLVSSNRCQ